VILDLTTGKSRHVVPDTKAYYENRVVVWRDDQSLFYIDPDNSTRLLDLTTGATEEIIARQGNVPSREDAAVWGYLPNRQLTYATTGYASFSPLNEGKVEERYIRFGCQPYFTHEGNWGFWTQGVGGPISRIRLATTEVSTIIGRFDQRMNSHNGFGYNYFPMISRSSRAIVFGASKGEHDHWNADYEIFLAPLDTESLGITGPIKRISEWEGTDRFPDVWIPALSWQISGEGAPFVAELNDAAGTSPWSWSINNKTVATTTENAFHPSFSQVGLYQIKATSSDGATTLGEIRIRPQIHPTISLAMAAAGQINLRFDEPVIVGEGAVLKLGPSTLAIPATEVGQSVEHVKLELPHRALAITPDQPTFTITGIADRFGNALPEGPHSLSAATWPGPPPDGTEQWAFAWQNAKQPVPGVPVANIVRHGGCVLDRRFHLRSFGKGGATFEAAGKRLAEKILASGEFSFEMTLLVPTPFTQGPGQVIALAAPDGTELFGIIHGENQLFAQVGTTEGLTWDERIVDDAPVIVSPVGFPISDIRPGIPLHLVVQFADGELVAYADGVEIIRTDRFRGELKTLADAELVTGFRRGGQGFWDGTICGISISDKARSAEDIATSASAAKALFYAGDQAENAVPRLRVGLRATRRSYRPTAKDVSPYREALVIDEAKVEWVNSDKSSGEIEGIHAGSTIRVSQWALLDGKKWNCPLGSTEVVEVWIEPLDAHPELESTASKTNLPEDFVTPLVYALPERPLK